MSSVEIASERESPTGPLLTVIIPVFNEAGTIVPLLEAVLAAPYDKQIVVVDDGSTDGTAEMLVQWRNYAAVEVIRLDSNAGKGRAIRVGLRHARGEFVIIQDADLEYNPQDYRQVIEPLHQRTAQVVFGSRYLAKPMRSGGWAFRQGVRVLNGLVRLLYGVSLTDEATCYKAMATSLLRRMELRCERFEFCPEVTAKVCRIGLPILEVPISYSARSQKAGKKIRWVDGLAAARTLWRWRHWEAPPADRSLLHRDNLHHSESVNAVMADAQSPAANDVFAGDSLSKTSGL